MITLLKAEDLVATIQTVDSHIGYLFWFNIGSQYIKAEELKQKLIESGMGEEWMPSRIRAIDAFRRATRESQKKKHTSDPKILKNYLIKEVYRDQEKVQRNLVLEHVNKYHKELGYETEVAIIELDRKHGSIYFKAEEGYAKEICEEIVERFNNYMNHFDSQKIRRIVSRFLTSLAPTPMRENGIIYFIPRSREEGIISLVNFINSLEGAEAYSVLVVDSKDSRNMISKRLNAYFDNLLLQCRNTEALRKDQIREIIDSANRAIKDFNEYYLIVAHERHFLEEKIKLLKKELTNIY